MHYVVLCVIKEQDGSLLCLSYLLTVVFVYFASQRKKLVKEQSVVVFKIETRCSFDVDHGRDDFFCRVGRSLILFINAAAK